MPDHYRYGGGLEQSLLHPLVACLLAAALICILLLPRRYASIPLVWMVLFVPLAQQVYVAGLHLFALRIVVLAGVVRAIASGGVSTCDGSGAAGIDRAFLVCSLAQTAAPILLFRNGSALVYQLGYFWDWFGGYFLCRWLIQKDDDLYVFLKTLAICMIPVTLGMIVEQRSLFNPFSVLGGIPVSPLIREGKIRSQGIFSHSLMAGSFAAVTIPLFFLLWKSGRARIFASIGILCASLMVLTSNSSTTLLADIGGMGVILLWPLRRNMRRIRIALVSALILLHIAMKAPVWFLIARIDLTGGSSSYHRAELIDAFIHNFAQWWLIGTDQNGSWGLDMFDVQNQFVNVGIAGGLLALVFFVITLSRGFSAIGRARWRARGERREEWKAWLLGCSLFANVVAFFGVNYFDQGRMIYLAVLAMIAAFANQSIGMVERSEATAPNPHALPLVDEEWGVSLASR